MWSVAGQAPALVEPTEQCAWLAVGGVYWLPFLPDTSASLLNSHAWQALPHFPDAVQGPLNSPHEHSQLTLTMARSVPHHML